MPTHIHNSCRSSVFEYCCTVNTVSMAVLLKALILCSIQILNVEGVSKKKGVVHMVGDWKCGDDLALDNVEWW